MCSPPLRLRGRILPLQLKHRLSCDTVSCSFPRHPRPGPQLARVVGFLSGRGDGGNTQVSSTACRREITRGSPSTRLLLSSPSLTSLGLANCCPCFTSMHPPRPHFHLDSIPTAFHLPTPTPTSSRFHLSDVPPANPYPHTLSLAWIPSHGRSTCQPLPVPLPQVQHRHVGRDVPGLHQRRRRRGALPRRQQPRGLSRDSACRFTPGPLPRPDPPQRHSFLGLRAGQCL